MLRRSISSFLFFVIAGGALYVFWPVISADYWPHRRAYYDTAVRTVNGWLGRSDSASSAPRSRLHRSHGAGASATGGLAASDSAPGGGDAPATVDSCPEGTVYIPDDNKPFCIDEFEYPNRRGVAPTVLRDWHLADAACHARLRRLCTAEEWEEACRGEQHFNYSVTDAKLPPEKVCNGADPRGQRRPVEVSGSRKDCRSSFGVADMSGNAAEWTSTPAPDSPLKRVIMGGSAGDMVSDLRCDAQRVESTTASSDLVGFRCCADPTH